MTPQFGPLCIVGVNLEQNIVGVVLIHQPILKYIVSILLGCLHTKNFMNIMQRQKHEENRHGDQENLLVVAGTRRAQW